MPAPRRTAIPALTVQIAQALRLHGRDRHAVKLAGDQQTHQPLRVALIGLHAIRRPPRDQPRRAHQTVHPGRLQPTREREPGRPRLIRRAPDQPGQPRTHTPRYPVQTASGVEAPQSRDQ
jgi:hypothetical protein